MVVLTELSLWATDGTGHSILLLFLSVFRCPICIHFVDPFVARRKLKEAAGEFLEGHEEQGHGHTMRKGVRKRPSIPQPSSTPQMGR
jgi:hypothetical protein